jgi:hypothetical protein
MAVRMAGRNVGGQLSVIHGFAFAGGAVAGGGGFGGVRVVAGVRHGCSCGGHGMGAGSRGPAEEAGRARPGAGGHNRVQARAGPVFADGGPAGRRQLCGGRVMVNSGQAAVSRAKVVSSVVVPGGCRVG